MPDILHLSRALDTSIHFVKDIASFAHYSFLMLYSVMQFDHLYGLAIDRAEQAITPHKRIENINERLTYDIYLYFQRGLFESHKMVFGLMLAFAILVAAGKVDIESSPPRHDVDKYVESRRHFMTGNSHTESLRPMPVIIEAVHSFRIVAIALSARPQ